MLKKKTNQSARVPKSPMRTVSSVHFEAMTSMHLIHARDTVILPPPRPLQWLPPPLARVMEHNTFRSLLSCRFGQKVAVVVFAIPTGIFGNGFEEMIMHRKKQKEQLAELAEQQEGGVQTGYAVDSGSERPGFAFLDTTCTTGKVYSGVLAVVILLNVATYFASTLSYLQVRMCILNKD